MITFNRDGSISNSLVQFNKPTLIKLSQPLRGPVDSNLLNFVHQFPQLYRWNAHECQHLFWNVTDRRKCSLKNNATTYFPKGKLHLKPSTMAKCGDFWLWQHKNYPGCQILRCEHFWFGILWQTSRQSLCIWYWNSRHSQKMKQDGGVCEQMPRQWHLLMGVAVASARPYANHLHLTPDRLPCQHLINQFLALSFFCLFFYFFFLFITGY